MHLAYPQKDCSSPSTHLYHILYHFHWFFQPIHRNDPKLGLCMFCSGNFSIPPLILALKQKPLPCAGC